MRKRRIVGALILCAALGAAYTGYWFWLARTFEQQLILWVDQQRAVGYRIQYSAVDPGGYPWPVRIALTNITAESAAGDPPWRFDTASMQLAIAPWNPLALRIDDGGAESQSRLQWSAAGRSLQMSFDNVKTTIKLSADSGPPSITVGAQSVGFTVNGQEVASAYQLSGQVDLQRAASPTDSSAEFSFAAYRIDLQQVFQEIHSPWLKGRIVGSIPPRPLAQALAEWSNQGGYLDLTSISADGSPPRFEGSATLALDPRLQPIGAGTVTVRNFNQGVDRAVAEGLMTSTQGMATKVWLNAKAESDDGGSKVRLPITLQDGVVSMGPVKLAQLPPFVWQ